MPALVSGLQHLARHWLALLSLQRCTPRHWLRPRGSLAFVGRRGCRGEVAGQVGGAVLDHIICILEELLLLVKASSCARRAANGRAAGACGERGQVDKRENCRLIIGKSDFGRAIPCRLIRAARAGGCRAMNGEDSHFANMQDDGLVSQGQAASQGKCMSTPCVCGSGWPLSRPLTTCLPVASPSPWRRWQHDNFIHFH